MVKFLRFNQRSIIMPTSRKSNQRRRHTRALIALLLLLPLLTLSLAAPLQAQDDCTTLLNSAEQKYFAGQFDEAIDGATSCLSRENLSEAEKLRGYRIVSLAYIAKGYQDQAKNAVQKLLELVPNYEPDPDQELPQFINLVKTVKQGIEDMRKQQEQPRRAGPESKPPDKKEVSGKKGGGTKWILIGGGVVVAGVGAALALGGGGGGGPTTTPPPQLPTPPPLP
jgi:hypothetical protein